MTIEDVLQKITTIGIIPVIRATSAEEANQAVEAVCKGGIPVVEITMTVPDAPSVIRRVVEQQGDRVLVGAGTVLTAEQAKTCLDAGAEFLVSPGFSAEVLDVARQRGKLAIPGALTPSELMQAIAHGAKVVKIFPCGSVGGAKYLKSLKAPFPKVAMVPTGGVNAGNAKDYFAAGALALGIGADLVDLAALRAGDSAKVTAAAKDLVEAVRDARA
jgi:2-dehydro-3-deoxyphosphogluconate aldolase/(4S)-4-hydroxy-2-oxoglutarate aldolase